MTETQSRETRHAASRLLFAALASAFLALLALRIIPPTSHELGPTTVSARAELGRGQTTLLVSPLGTVSAQTHAAPLHLDLTITEIDPTSLGDAVSSGTGRQDLVKSVERDLRSTTIRIVVQLALGAAVIGAIVGALLPRRRWTTVLAGASGAGLVVGVLLAATAATFEVEAFAEPRFSGALERAPEVIAAVNREFGSFEELSSRYEKAASRLSELLSLVAEPTPGPTAGSVSILHISDIHSNPIGVQIAAQLAREFDVDAVLDTGDVTSFGASIEARMSEFIERVPAPYLFVPGNHDSPANRTALARAKNVTLLDGDVVNVAGIDILGWADPTFTATRDVSTEEGNAIRVAEAERVAQAVADELPDVLAVHDARLAEDSIGDVSLILAGHTHEEAFEVDDGTTVMTVGSTGATGLGSFFVEVDVPYEAEIIYFEGDRAVAYDYISLSGPGLDFTVERHTLAQEE
jgi:predicted phosphodiesterase